MKLHLINGFLGSGKTTAIIAATRHLVRAGKTVGIVTNDKGRFQVDQEFFHRWQVPTQQVTGGCFRCSFDEFQQSIEAIQQAYAPDILFAESVGSCVDLVNTIFDPLKQNASLQMDLLTYTMFADIRLFKRWVNDEPLPFSDSILYLFAKQIEESKLLILNKVDLLTEPAGRELQRLAQARFPGKDVILQNSLEEQSVVGWLDRMEELGAVDDRPGFVVDYPTYKRGEKEMAWLDQRFTILSAEDGKAREAVLMLAGCVLEGLHQAGDLVGHVKLLVSDAHQSAKTSLTTADFLEAHLPSVWMDGVPACDAGPVELLLNARVAMDAERFAAIVTRAVEAARSTGVEIRGLGGQAYHPEMSLARPRRPSFDCQ
jgi:Ni2+-binding GTPase involved in maturation of urease and hydrogenase